MSLEIIDWLKSGTKANYADNCRQGNLINLPLTGSVVVGGDIHGHCRNFERIRNYSQLKDNPDRHLVLQEIIHGQQDDKDDDSFSFELLAEAARLKSEFPNQIHIIMGNHDTAFINNTEVMKNGREMNAVMRTAMSGRFGADAESLANEIEQFLFSQPLAVRCANRIWISHSLPSDRYVGKFDTKIFHKQLKVSDIVRPNSAYLLTWGRRHSQDTLDKLAGMLDVDLFVLGHQMQEKGWTKAGDNAVIIISEHNHGTLLDIDLAKSYGIDELIGRIIPLASIS